MFMIVETDNFAGDYPDEKEVCFQNAEGGYLPLVFATEEQAQKVADAFNEVLSAEFHPRIYMVKPNTYILQGGFEP